MLSLFEKARVVTLGNLHELADRVIDLNSPAAVKQYIRDIETAENQIGKALATNAAERAGLERELKVLHDQEAQLNQDAQALATAGKDESATKVLMHLEQIEAQIAPKEQQMQSAEATKTNLKSAVSALDSKKQTMQNRLTEIEAMTAQAQGLEAGASAMRLANSAVNTVGGAGIDDMASRAQARVDKAQAVFDQQNGAITDTVGQDLAAIRAQQRLAELKGKIGQAQPAAATA